jgi:peptidyl-prolyl cis-trans isomerase SurA
MKLTDEQFKSAVDNIRKENNIETEEQFQAALRQEKMTMTELRAGLERQMLVQQVRRNEVIGRVGVTEEESRRYYDAHASEFTSVPSVTLREILVAAPADGSGDAAAKAKAEQIRQRAQAGEAFDKLAVEVSDSPSKANGGLVGPLSLSDLSNDLRTLLESMKENDLTPVLKTSAGFQVLKLETMSAADTKPFALAKPDIDNKVFEIKMRDETERYLVKLRSQAIIEWKNPDLKKAYEQGLKARAPQSPADTAK